MKKILSILLSIMMIFGMVSASATEATATQITETITSVDSENLENFILENITEELSAEESELVKIISEGLVNFVKDYKQTTVFQDNGLFYEMNLGEDLLLSLNFETVEDSLLVSSNLMPTHVISIPVNEIINIVTDNLASAYDVPQTEEETLTDWVDLMELAFSVYESIPEESLNNIKTDLEALSTSLTTQKDDSTFTHNGIAYPNQMTFNIDQEAVYTFVDTFVRNLPKETYDIFDTALYAKVQEGWKEVTEDKAEFFTAGSTVLNLDLFISDEDKSFYYICNIADTFSLEGSVSLQDEAVAFTLTAKAEDEIIADCALTFSETSFVLEYAQGTTSVLANCTMIDSVVDITIDYTFNEMSFTISASGVYNSEKDASFDVLVSSKSKKLVSEKVELTEVPTRSIDTEGKEVVVVDINLSSDELLELFAPVLEEVKTSTLTAITVLAKYLPAIQAMMEAE